MHETLIKEIAREAQFGSLPNRFKLFFPSYFSIQIVRFFNISFSVASTISQHSATELDKVLCDLQEIQKKERENIEKSVYFDFIRR